VTIQRIDETFARLAKLGRKALIPFITSGHPEKTLTVGIMHAMVKGGADIIELGVPFSDPMADGPAIQKSNEQALAQGVGMKDVLAYVKAFRSQDQVTPIVLMGYANPIERMGPETFFKSAAEVGVDGVIVVDYPPEEAAVFAETAGRFNIAPIFLLAPTSGDDRIAQVAKLAKGYVYYVSLKGITGAANIDAVEVARKVAHIRSFISLPIGVGFGIRDGATAKAVGAVSDAVIIGSKMIQLLEEGDLAGGAQRAQAFMSEVREALDALDHA
jgi:tryptophan synthase alpha chain